MNLVQEYLAFFAKEKLNLSEARVAIAVSTGADSMALLSAALCAREIVPHSIIVFHVNHHLRAQSAEEETYIRSFCAAHDIPLKVLSLYEASGPGYEARAHDARYAFFKQAGREYRIDILLTAHHAEDALETVLMRIARGSGLLGYIGLPLLTQKDGLLIGRPFLEVTKPEITDYLSEKHIKYYEDETNELDDVLRNRIRHEALPVLASAGALKGIAHYREVLQGAYSVINDALSPFMKTLKRCDDALSFELPNFLALSPFLREEALFRLVAPSTPSSALVREALKGLVSSTPHYEVMLSNVHLVRSYDCVTLSRVPLQSATIPSITIHSLGRYDLGDNITLVVRKKNANDAAGGFSLWYNEKDLPVTVRARLPGDRITTLGGTKKVKSLLIDEKVPIAKRDRVVIVEKEGKILAVLGYARAAEANLMKSEADIVLLLETKKEG